MADSLTSVPEGTGASRVAILAGVGSGILGTALFQALLSFSSASRVPDWLLMIIPVGLAFGLTMAWLGRRFGGLGPVWATLTILATPIIYFLAVVLAMQVYSLANDFGFRDASITLACAGAFAGAAGAAGLLLITLMRRRRALVGSAMVVVVSAVAGALTLAFCFTEQGGTLTGYFLIHTVWQAAFLSTFLFTLTSSQQR